MLSGRWLRRIYRFATSGGFCGEHQYGFEVKHKLSDKHKLLLLPQLVTSFERIASDSYLFADSRKKRRGGTAGMMKKGEASSTAVT